MQLGREIMQIQTENVIHFEDRFSMQGKRKLMPFEDAKRYATQVIETGLGDEFKEIRKKSKLDKKTADDQFKALTQMLRANPNQGNLFPPT